ncbi:hypothetical protein AAMO2058_000446600 [Amorphochlora amoebiformis]
MPLRVTLHYEEGRERHLQLRIKVPKSWRESPVNKLTNFFVESYNNKFPDAKLDEKTIHAESAGGRKFHADDIIEESFIHKEHIYIKDGAPPKNEKKIEKEKMEDPSMITCHNFGCQYRFRKEDNHPRACWHHRKGPVFWNGYKYWACCEDRKAYDWNDFMKVPGCVCGPHSSEKPKGTELISPTIIAARQAEAEAKKQAAMPQLKDIKQYTNKTVEENKLKPKRVALKPKTPLPEGCSKCVHMECKKVYAIEDNNDKACKYHSGTAIFHDGAKYWSCCTENRKCYDWDSFMKIPKCRVGFHWDGEGTDPNESK